MNGFEKLQQHVNDHPYPLVFATISGAHLYGFPSPDSDFDLRGIHLLPLKNVVGLDVKDETIEKSGVYDGIEVDLVTHDARKFFGLLLKKNGYVLEQIFSPLVVHTTPHHGELREIAKHCITRHHSHHYLGFAETQWKLFRKEDPPRVKPLLYVYRVLLTGIHLMRTGEVEANLLKLNETARLSYINDLVERKLAGPEKSVLPEASLDFHEREYQRLVSELENASAESHLPERATGRDALNDLLTRLRLVGIDNQALQSPGKSTAQLNLVVIRSVDIGAAVGFYRGLGIHFTEEHHGNGPRHFAASLDSLVFEIYPAKNPEDVDRTTRLGFSVSELPVLLDSLRTLGTPIVTEASQSPWGVRAVVRDPDGRAVELIALQNERVKK